MSSMVKPTHLSIQQNSWRWKFVKIRFSCCGRKENKINSNKYLLSCTTEMVYTPIKDRTLLLTFIFHQKNNDGSMMAYKCTLNASNVFLSEYLTRSSSTIAPFIYSLNYGRQFYFSFLPSNLKKLKMSPSAVQHRTKAEDVNASPQLKRYTNSSSQTTRL